MCLGDSVLLSMNGASRVACSSPPFLTVAVPPVSKHGDQYRLPLAVHPPSRKRLPAIRAAKSGSVDAPESSSSPSISTSNGTFEFSGCGPYLCTLIQMMLARSI